MNKVNTYWRNLMKDKFKRYLNILSNDELNDSNRLIQFIGIVFIILALLNFTNFFILNSLTLISISLSGIFFILADFCEYYNELEEKKEAIPYSVRKVKIRIYRMTKAIFHFFAILALIIGPYLSLEIDTNMLDKLSTFFSLLAIGLTVLKIGKDHAKKNLYAQKQLMDEVNEVFKTLEKDKVED